MPDIPAILSGLQSSQTILDTFILEIPRKIMTRVRGEGVWSIAEHLDHLAAVQPMLTERFRRIINEENPEFVPFIPGDAESSAKPAQIMPPEQALTIFRFHREEQLTLLEAQPASAWTREATHPEYEQYGLHILARHALMHDHWHLYRMEELWLTRDEYLTVLPG
ncbi:DinB family protein [Desulfovibrio ferrophilus]|uniref:DinB family protein n=1 Tax=Desulfovibrio ferrophilus TaxID=241368 RepID=A0A2Z6AYQ7_9BACT|nr:DinB family protein [Desulfovibrio ferrophilus]BBD08330.1 DinB family protein [Desulfovibrio ferrophilus]